MTPFLKLVAEDLVRRFGDDLQQSVIVFNNNRPAIYLQKYLAEEFKKPFFSPSIFTVQEFFAVLSKQKVADFYTQFYTLFNAFNKQLISESKATILSSQFFPLAQTILSDFSQLDAELANADQLFEELKDIAQIEYEFDDLSKEQHEFLSNFWKSYSEGYQNERKQRFIELWYRMPKIYHQFHQDLAAEGFITFGKLYAQIAQSDIAENEFIKTLGQGKIIFVGFNALSKAEAKLFKQLQELGKALFYFDTDHYYLDDELQEAGLFLRKNLKQLALKNVFEQADNSFSAAQHQVEVYSVQGKTIQSKILNKIIDFDKISAEELNQTTVILADESLLIPTLQSIDEKIEVNVTMGYALSQSLLFGIISLWLETQLELNKQQKIKHQIVEKFITHPLTGLSTVMINKVQAALIDGNEVQVSTERLIRQGGIFEIFFKKAEDSSQLIPNLIHFTKFILDRAIQQHSLKKLDAQLFVQSINELTRMNDVVGVLIKNEEPKFVIQLIQKTLNNISVPLKGEATKGLQIMGLLESRNLNFERVIFLGFNEGNIPKTSLANSFIPDSIRRAYGLPVLENLDAISSYMVYRLIQRAKHISLVYNNLTDENNSGEPSRILRQLEYESKFDFNYHQLVLPIQTEKFADISISKKDPKIKAALQRYLDGKRYLSPSALCTYICNPADFFFNYIAGIKEPEEVTEEVKANKFGLVVHKVMEDFYQTERNKEITKELISIKRKNVNTLINNAFNKEMKVATGHEYDASQKIILAIVKEYVNILLNRDEADAPFVIKDLEYQFKEKLSFELNNKIETITINGVIDRIDERQGITRIIDYKTGSDELKFSTLENLFDGNQNGINKALIQTLIYTYLYAEKHQIKHIEPQLYILKELTNDSQMYFQSAKLKLILNENSLASIKDEFMTLLKEKIAEIFNEGTEFYLSKEPKNYPYSIFKTIYGV